MSETLSAFDVAVAALFKASNQPNQVEHKPSCQCGRCLACRLQVRAVLAALRLPHDAMLVAAREWSRAKYGMPIGDGAATGCLQAMLDAVRDTKQEEPMDDVVTLSDLQPAGPLITHKEVIGQMALWAVRQHPYGRPDGLFEITDAIRKAAEAWPDGVPSLRMWRVGGWHEIEDWLRGALAEHPVLTAWNKPRSGHTVAVMFTSRYDRPKPENDFIDIDALLRNVALGVWREAKREETDGR
jgi:hypothetical protein